MRTWTHPRHPLIEASCAEPVIAANGVLTRIIAGRFRSGESIFDLTTDYRFNGTEEVEAALRFELDASAKRAWRKWYREAGR